ncbi:MAG: hypothetical protein WBP71_10045 [Terracidiphilus sp.]
MGKKKINPHCPVAGCRVFQPHTDDPIVKLLVDRFAASDRSLSWIEASLCELRDSMIDDCRGGRMLGFITRLRQIEEIYIRTLYILFVAPAEDTPHILSGDTPNSLTHMYDSVNEEIFDGRGELTTEKSGLSFGQFKPMDILHSGAHAGFRAMQMVVLITQFSEKPISADGYLQHVGRYIERVNHMRKLFEAGRDLQVVKQCIKNMHTPIEEFQRRAAAEAKETDNQTPTKAEEAPASGTSQ